MWWRSSRKCATSVSSAWCDQARPIWERGSCRRSAKNHALSASSAIGNQGSRTLLYGVIETEIRWLLMSVLTVGNRFSLRRFGTCPDRLSLSGSLWPWCLETLLMLQSSEKRKGVSQEDTQSLQSLQWRK